jgi:hypothetical protein
MHYLIEEFNRIAGVSECRPDVFRRIQRQLISEVQPLLDERDALLQRVVQLEAELVARPGRKGKGSYAEVS